MTEQRAKYLLSLYFRQGCTPPEHTPPEQEELYQWIHDCPDDEDLRRIMQEVWADFAPTDVMDNDKAKQMLSRILTTADDAPPVKRMVRPMARKWMAAAAVLVIAGSVSFYYLDRKKSTASLAAPPEIAKINAPKGDVLPGTTNATLTLDDGSSIVLDTVSSATVASQGSTRIIKQNGQVVYQNRDNAPNTAGLIYNTLSTSRGHEYPLTLSDGTKVWLNASSSIRFPVQFSDKQRAVSITGEVYFEVAKNSKPFSVSAGGARVEVLGTHFNINAYEDETRLNTTLIEGAVRIIKGSSSMVLAPGQQAQIHKNGSMELNKDADMEGAISWTQGYFHFKDASLETVLRQLSRWYDVDVIYEKHPADETFSGDIQKSLSLSQVLKILEKSQVRFQINGKRLIVTN
jgi:ferric-dicitrate binding protein FerR (iron transport regulator)